MSNPMTEFDFMNTNDLQEALDNAVVEIERLRAENAVLIEALKPFAALALHPSWRAYPDDLIVYENDTGLLTMRDFRKAKAICKARD